MGRDLICDECGRNLLVSNFLIFVTCNKIVDLLSEINSHACISYVDVERMTISIEVDQVLYQDRAPLVQISG